MTLRFLTAGESHGPALTTIIEGLPAGLELNEEIIMADLARRQSGAGSGDRMAIEKDRAHILSGLMSGVTTGAPLTLQLQNADHANWKGKEIPAYTTPRPGHADLAAVAKYRYNDIRPSLERASARETASRVATGAVCRTLLKHFGIDVAGYVVSIGANRAELEGLPHEERVTRARRSEVQCPDPDAATRMIEQIEWAKNAGETLGGIVQVTATGVPVGLGSHVNWDRRLDSRLARMILSMNAVKGVEIGDAFANATRPGTEAHDAVELQKDGTLTRRTNACGGIEGGISNGEPVWLRAAIKPIPTTRKGQDTIDLVTGKPILTYYERSDICPIPRAVVILESLVNIVIADALLEKLGGDSMPELQQRFKNLRRTTFEELRLAGGTHTFWP